MLRAEERSREIRFEDVVPRLPRDVCQSLQMPHACVVDQDVGFAELVGDHLGQCPDAVLSPDVELRGESGAARRHDLPGHGSSVRKRAGGTHDRGALLLRQFERDRPADAAICAGDNRNPPREIHARNPG